MESLILTILMEVKKKAIIGYLEPWLLTIYKR